MLDTKKRINQLDGLRAIAIILFFLHHIVTKPFKTAKRIYLTLRR